MGVEEDIRELRNHVSNIDKELGEIREALGTLKGSQETTVLILKWVVTPLIIILGALIGVDIVLP